MKLLIENSTNLEILIFVLESILILIISYQVYRIGYQRYYKSFKKEVIKLLESNGLKTIDLRHLDSNEQKLNPFGFKESNIMGMISSRALFSDLYYWKKSDYRIAIAINKDSEEYRIWIKINTIYFKKPEFSIIKQKILTDSKNMENKDKNYWSCPACGYNNSIKNSVCHDCGICFV
jgi:hypothetical protein